MKRKLLCVLAVALVIALSTTAMAATAEGVQALWQEVGDGLEELRGKTLTETQQEALKSIQDGYFKLAHGKRDTEREAKLAAFKETLSESQKTAFEAFMPKLPEGEFPSDGTQPTGTPPARPEGDVTGERPAPPSGERPTGAPPARPEGGDARPAPAEGEQPNGAPPAGGGGRAMTEEERAAMQEKRDAFAATLTEAQKAIYEEIFPVKAPEGQGEGEGRKPPQTEIDLSSLTVSELAELEARLNELLAQLKQI